MKQHSALSLIKRFLKKKQSENPKFSLRALALKVGVSNGHLSKVLRGQKSLSGDLVISLCDQLGLDSLQTDQVYKAFTLAIAQQKILNHAGLPGQAPTVVLEEFELGTRDSEWILSKWYYTAILDLMTCDEFKEADDWIAGRLQILPAQAREALKALQRTDLIFRDSHGILRKKYEKLRFPTSISKRVFRDFHKAQMKRAIQLLDIKNSPEDFNVRLIAGLTLATNPQNLEKAKAFLHAALYEAAEILSQGTCTEVYQLNLQLFPQTNFKN